MVARYNARQPRHAGFPSCSRRDFLILASAAAAVTCNLPSGIATAEEPQKRHGGKQHARVRAVFLYPPSRTFAETPDAWWSWPGNDFDAEGRQRRFTAAFRQMEKKLGVTIQTDDRPVASDQDAERLIRELEATPPDGFLLVMFYNYKAELPNKLLAAAEKLGTPVVFYIALGARHGPITAFNRPGIYFIQSLDNIEAIEAGMRMIDTKKLLAQSRLLSIAEADGPSESVEGLLGVTVRVIPFAQYAERFRNATIDREARAWTRHLTQHAKEVRGVTAEAMENAARAHIALKQLIAEEGADGVTMNCLRRGMLKPCISFSRLNSELIPAACENDLSAAYTQMLGQLLTERPGLQHNPAFETERNHYYASHCTCPTKVFGPNAKELPYLLRRFAHTNEGSCAIQVFWRPDDPVTIVHYYPGDRPALDVYAGRVVKSHLMPPAGGCTTNVEVEITDRRSACSVEGHHNILFCGDFARLFRTFAQLYRLKLRDTGFDAPWPA